MQSFIRVLLLSVMLNSGSSFLFQSYSTRWLGPVSLTKLEAQCVPFRIGCNKELSVPPKGFTREYSDKSIVHNGPSCHNLKIEWSDSPKKILFLAKKDASLQGNIATAMKYLIARGFSITLERGLHAALIEKYPNLLKIEPGSDSEIHILEDSMHLDSIADFVITFGGDGLLLHLNTLFAGRNVPPVMSFDMGSLGFLCPFSYENFFDEIDTVLKNKAALLTLRMRMECSIWRNNEMIATHTVLNEAVVDRGPSPFLSLLDLSCDSQYITTSQGDGVIFATPTGSTAYSLAAGGCIVFPSVPVILLTPICPHTLSFRPMLFPDSATLTCQIPEDSRAHAWASFDGKNRCELMRGDRLEIRVSNFPLPTINKQNYTSDWTDALRSRFMFNLRNRQKGH